MKYTALVCAIVGHGTGEKLADYLRENGSLGGTILVGRGTRNSAFLRFLAMADTERDLLLTLVSGGQLETMLEAIRKFPIAHKADAGIAFSICTGGNAMTQETDHELISVIVNRGYADDIMDAARKAGARGGTILHARGTGKPDDEKFFGISIVPEKEQVLILAERGNAKAIREAIETLPCLDTPGIGILYTMPVEHFVQLGPEK